MPRCRLNVQSCTQGTHARAKSMMLSCVMHTRLWKRPPGLRLLYVTQALATKRTRTMASRLGKSGRTRLTSSVCDPPCGRT